MKVKSRLMAALGSLKEQSNPCAGATILSTIETAILRSTEHVSSAPDDKYVHEILFEISNAPGAITYLVRRITARLASNQNVVVALKTLLLLHRLLRGGDRYFEQDLHGLWASGDLRINLKWMAGDPDPLCSFALCYSQFLGERMEWIINQAGNLEPNRTLLVSESTSKQSFQEKKVEFVLYRMSKCQTFLDKIMYCLPTACCNNINNSMSNYAMSIHQSVMSIILRESFRVYGSFCDDMDIVSSSFLELKKPLTVLAVDIFRKACRQTSGLRDYYDNCKKFMAGKSFDYPMVRVFTAADFSWTESSSSMPSRRDEEEDAADGVDDGPASLKRPFSGGMETRISTVWVDFDEEEDAQSSSFSLDGFEDYVTVAAGAGAAEGGTSVEGKGTELL